MAGLRYNPTLFKGCRSMNSALVVVLYALSGYFRPDLQHLAHRFCSHPWHVLSTSTTYSRHGAPSSPAMVEAATLRLTKSSVVLLVAKEQDCHLRWTQETDGNCKMGLDIDSESNRVTVFSCATSRFEPCYYSQSRDPLPSKLVQVSATPTME